MNLREKKIAKKKEDILHSAISIFAEKGYHGTTMEDVAAKLYMTTGTIYYYFKDKQELLFESQLLIVNKSLDMIRGIYEEDLNILEKFHKAISSHVDYVINERTFFETMIKPEQILSESQLETITKLKNEYNEVFDKLLNEAIEQGYFKNFEIKIVRNLLIGAMNSTMQWYSFDGSRDSKDFSNLIADYLTQFLLVSQSEVKDE